MTPVEACKALNENSVNAVRRLAAHLNTDPVALAKVLEDGGLVELVEALQTFIKEGTTLTSCDRGFCQRVIEKDDRSDPQAKMIDAFDRLTKIKEDE